MNLCRVCREPTANSCGFCSAECEADEDGRGMKFDEGKLDWWLVPPEFEHVVRVLMYGADKYMPENWRKVQDWRRLYYNAARRHLEAWRGGEMNDDESGLPHLAHATCCLLFLLALDDEHGAFSVHADGG